MGFFVRWDAGRIEAERRRATTRVAGAVKVGRVIFVEE